MAENLKILVAGDVEGKFDTLFQRVQTINQKNGPFDMVLCVGEFFSTSDDQWTPYQSGQKKVMIPTFVLGPSRKELTRYFPDLKGCELCPNITYLGDHGIYTGSSGLKIVYISGNQKKDPAEQSGFSMDAIKAIEVQLLNSPKFTGVDILLTNQWPRGVEQHAAQLDGVTSEKCGSPLLSRLASKIKPRYFFCGLEGIHYERTPYRNHQVLQESSQHVTRFISLAKVGNSTKLKWLYAFNITPMAHTPIAKLIEQPPVVTPCPFDVNVEEQDKSEKRQEALSNQYFYDVSADVMAGKNRQGMKRKHNQQDRPSRPPPKPMGPCWFCLSSPEVEKHLVVSVGEHTYLALPKGGLVPGHVLILPVGHYQSSVDLPEEVLEEVDKFKMAIMNALKSKDQSVVFFERNFKSPHLQIQCVPIPTSKNEIVKEVFIDTAAMHSITLDEVPEHAELRQIIRPGSPYFYLELPGEKRFVCHIRGRFPLQFGREVMAQSELHSCPQRVDWKNCSTSRDQEIKDTTAFRQLFQPFDFTL